MMRYAIAFVVVALGPAFLGTTPIESGTLGGAKILFVFLSIAATVALIVRELRRDPSKESRADDDRAPTRQNTVSKRASATGPTPGR